MAINKPNSGYIALHRKIQNNFLWKKARRKEFSEALAWIDILMQVQHSISPQKVMLGMTVLTCNYGQSLKSIGTWAERWNWSPSKVRRFFQLLKREKMIETESVLKSTRLTVCNYKRYDPKRIANGEQTATDNNVNNDTIIDTEEFQLSELLFKEIKKRKPDYRKPNLQEWAIHIDRMIRLDNRDPARIESVIRWCQQDGFWQNNILSTKKLRKQFDQLELRMKERGSVPAITPLERDEHGKTPAEKFDTQLQQRERNLSYAEQTT